MAIFNEMAKATLDELQGFITTEMKDKSQAALADAKEFLKQSQEDLQRWSLLLAGGQLTPEDFAWLAGGRRDLARLRALKRAGVSKVQLERFQNTLVAAATQAAVNLAGAGIAQVTAGSASAPATRGGAKPRAAARNGAMAKVKVNVKAKAKGKAKAKNASKPKSSAKGRRC